jgi:hypothetical protein
MIKQFYEKALPSQGVYCATGIDPISGKAVNKFAETLDDLLKLIERYKNNNQNTFFALATFEGWSRKADNALFLRSFFIDIDVGDSKSYQSKEEAHTALYKLIGATGLPEPIVVDSGGGIHAYWCMDRDIPKDEWKPYAEQFKALCLKHIKIDPTVTSDISRILRCPDTVNHKYDPPVTTSLITEGLEVYDFDEFKKFLATDNIGQPGNNVVDVFANVKKGLDEDTLAIKKIDNFEKSFQKIAERSLNEDGCEQVKYILENSATLEEPLWFAGLSIAKYCQDGNEAIHLLSEDHPDYKYEDTEEKASRIPAPRTCEWFNTNYPDRCKGCKHQGRIVSPISLGKVINEATEGEPFDSAESIREVSDTKKIPKFPEFLRPYYRGESGGIMFQPPPIKENKKFVQQDPYLILAHDLYPIRRMYSHLDGECMTMRLHLPHDGNKEFLLPMRVVYSSEELKKCLSSNQVIFELKHFLDLQNYFIKWDQYMVNKVRADIMRTQFGWSASCNSDEWEERTFVIGNTEIVSSTELRDAPVSPYIRQLAKYLKPFGTFEKWRASAQELTRPQFEIHALVCLSGFGSTLMEYINQGGFTLGLLGGSGCGKTGAMYAGVSAFGAPKELSVYDSTDNALTQRFVNLRSLMFGLDEVGNKDSKVLSDLIHKISQGSAKIRLQASVNAEREHTLNASLISVMTTNESIEGKVERYKNTPVGERARYAELYVEQPDALKGPEGEILGRQIFDTFRYNYGHAGPMFIQEVFKLSNDEIQERIKKWGERYLKDTNADSAYRYYRNFIAVSFTAGEILVDAGILDYDLEHIYAKTIDTLNYMKANISKINATDYAAVLNDFIYENMGNILRLKDGKVTDEPRGKLVARVSTDEPTRISKEAVKDYLNKRNINAREFEKALKEQGVLVKVDRKHLETGWKATTNSQASYVYVIKNDFLDVEPDTDN